MEERTFSSPTSHPTKKGDQDDHIVMKSKAISRLIPKTKFVVEQYTIALI